MLALQARSILRALRDGAFDSVRARLAAGPSAAEWLRYLRLPHRETFAGTPFDASGNEIVSATRSTATVSADAAPATAPVTDPARVRATAVEPVTVAAPASGTRDGGVRR